MIIKPNNLTQIAAINTEAYRSEGDTWYAFINKKGRLCCRSGDNWGKDEFFCMLNLVVQHNLSPFALYKGKKVSWKKGRKEINFYRENDNMFLYKIVL